MALPRMRKSTPVNKWFHSPRRLEILSFQNFRFSTSEMRLRLHTHICAEPVHTKGAKLCLYRLYTLNGSEAVRIFLVLSHVHGQPLGVSRATDGCVGVHLYFKAQTQKILTEARRTYYDSLLSKVDLTAQELFEATGRKGWSSNCPEFSTCPQRLLSQVLR